jgi:Fur family transcriptional regulator, peroxide stress response regulator
MRERMRNAGSDMERYKGIGLKLTPQRLAILQHLDGNKMHPSAEEIYTQVSKKFPTMSLATVYNTLEALRQKGKVQELTIDPDKKRFDPDIEPHHHLICTGCRRVVDVHVDYSLSVPAGERRDFEITGNHIEFYGLCPACRSGSGGEAEGASVKRTSGTARERRKADERKTRQA